MKKIFIYILTILAIVSFTACENNDVDTNNSIFNIDPSGRDQFDYWILENITHPYNIVIKYKMEDIESSMKHNLTPAKLDKSIMMTKLIKFMWLDVYHEGVGIEFIRNHTPRIIHLIGSPAYNNNNTVTLGTAEGALKVTLYDINTLTMEPIRLNDRYLHTLHHEFSHTLHQKIPYDVDYQKISEGKYVATNWYQISLSEALKAGFVSKYSMSEPQEDFVEVYSIFVTSTATVWDAMMVTAGETGKPIIDKKFEIMKSYFKNEWQIDVYKMRDIIQRRSTEISMLNIEDLD